MDNTVDYYAPDPDDRLTVEVDIDDLNDAWNDPRMQAFLAWCKDRYKNTNRIEL